jgi:hypothetical protein
MILKNFSSSRTPSLPRRRLLTDAARERTARYLLATRLKQMAARIETAAVAPGSDRLTGLAVRSLDGETAGAVMA